MSRAATEGLRALGYPPAIARSTVAVESTSDDQGRIGAEDFSSGILREAWVNFVYKDPATFTTLVDPLFLVAGTLTSIAPRTNHTTRGSCAAPADLRVVEVHGHYHAHTVRLSAWRVAAGQRTLVYESYDWHEPASLQFDSAHKNPRPNPQGLVPGGHNGLLELKRGDLLEWECEVHNDSDAPGTARIRDGVARRNTTFVADCCASPSSRRAAPPKKFGRRAHRGFWHTSRTRLIRARPKRSFQA